MCGRSSRIHSPHSTQSWVRSVAITSSFGPSSVVINGTRSWERNGMSCRMIAAWISPFSATAVIASSTLETTSSSNCTSSPMSRTARRLSARPSGALTGASSASSTV